MYTEQHNYLIHWLKKGEKAKYIDKVKLANGRWRYFYTQAEVDAYKRGLSKSAGSLADKAKQGLHNLKEGAASAAARGVVNVTSRNQRLRSLLGGQHQENAVGWNRLANASQQKAMAADRKAHERSAAAASQDRKNGSGALFRRSASFNREDAASYASNASTLRSKAAAEQKAYDRSIVGRAENRVAADARRSNNEKNRKVPVREAVGKAIDRETSLRTKVSRAASKAKDAVADRAAEAVVGAANKNSTVRNLIGGQHQDNARGWTQRANQQQADANSYNASAHKMNAYAASNARKPGYETRAQALRDSAKMRFDEAERYARNASANRSRAAAEQKAYESSLLGRAQARVNRKSKKKKRR